MAKTMDNINITLRNVNTDDGDSEDIIRIPVIMNVIPHQIPVPILPSPSLMPMMPI
jgi:hypothetical protein